MHLQFGHPAARSSGDKPADEAAADLAASAGVDQVRATALVAASDRASDLALRQLRDRQAAAMKSHRLREHGKNKKCDDMVPGDDTACPRWLAEKIPKRGAGYKYWFEMWLEQKRSFSAVVAVEIVRRRMTTRSLDKCAWLRGDEIYAMYPAKIAEALIKELGANSATNRAHPQMQKCEEARLYYVMTQMTVETETVLTHEQELKAMMNVEDGDDEGASALCDQVTHGIPEPLALQDAPASLPGVMPSPPAVSPAGRPGGHVGSDAGAPSLEEEEAKKEEAEQNKFEEEAKKEEAERNKKEAAEQKKREAKQTALEKKSSPMTKASERSRDAA